MLVRKSIVIFLSCITEFEGIAEDTTYFGPWTGRIRIILIWKPPAFKLALIVSEDAMQAAKGEKNPWLEML